MTGSMLSCLWEIYMSSSVRKILALVVLVIVIFLAYGFLTKPDHRGVGQKVDDAINALPQGMDKASRQLEDRTPGQKIGDAIRDAGDSIKKETAAPQQ